jgi:hypothetical protein
VGTVTATAAGETASGDYTVADPSQLQLSGTMTLVDFPNNNALLLPSTKRGLAGPGVVTIKPMSSTKASTVPTAAGTTNSLYLVRTAKGVAALFTGFTLQGTDQGHLYGGLMLDHTVGAQLTDVLVAGIPGNNGAPPGETFGVNDYGGNGTVFTRVEVDGRNLAGVRVGASGLATNSASNVTWIDCYVHDHAYGMPTFWQTVNITTRNLRSINNARGINHERASGVIRHLSPVLHPDLSKPAAMHMSLNNDQADAADVEIHDPDCAGGEVNGAFCLQMNDFYGSIKNADGTSQPQLNKQKTLPKVFRNGVLLPWADAGTDARTEGAITAPAVAAKNMAAAKADPTNWCIRYH